MTRAARYIGEALKPPSQLPLPEWAEASVRLDHTSYIQGRMSLEFYPQLRAFLSHANRRRMKRLTAMTSAQSAKTTAVMLTLLWRIAENPTPAMWVSATTEKAKEFAKRRLYPSILDCAAVQSLAPKDRSEWTARLVQFASMDLMIRGAVSKQDMTSDPVGLLICDERREWRPGMIELARKRIVTFGNAQELSIGTAGVKGDSLHRDFEEGSQGFLVFACPHCQHVQPFRFGRKASPLFPEARERGGVVWPDDERTRNADDSRNIEAIQQLAEYECEKCAGRITEAMRLPLLKTATEHHRNPRRLEEFPSLHWNVMAMPMGSLSFGAVAVEFVNAMAALKSQGDQEPLRTFVCDTLGEPWEMLATRVEATDVMARLGDYHFGERDEVNRTPSVDVLTIDRQKDHLVYVWRQWFKGGASRLVRAGKLPDDFAEVRRFQTDHRIKFVAGDDGGYEDAENMAGDARNVYRWRVACVQYGWHSLKGDKAANYVAESVRTYWKRSPFNTGAGGAVLHNAFLWCKAHYLNKLFNVFLKGEGPQWLLPRNSPAEYLHQLQSYEFREDGTGWVKIAQDHAASCELMQLVVADAANIVELSRPSENRGSGT
jgi:phage terminase large subunit GpA-like protein